MSSSAILESLKTPATSSPQRVLVILPRGETIRNFVYSGMIEELRRLVPVTVLSVIPSDDIGTLLESRCGQVLELTPTRQRWAPGFIAEILDLAHGRWLWSEAARERWRLREAEAADETERIKWKIKKLLALPFANRFGLRLLSGLRDRSSRLLRTTDDWVELLKTVGATLVFNGSHVHSHLAVPVVDAARWLNIPTAAFIFSWDNLTSQGRIIPSYDHYLVWSDGLRDQLLALYDRIDPARVYVTGTPQFDFHCQPAYRWDREVFCQETGADPKRPIVLYTTGMANHMPGEPRIVEGIAAMLRKMKDLGPPQLMVRVYPKDRTGRFQAVREQNPDVLFPAIPWEAAHLTPRPEDGALLTNMLLHAAVGINVASTVTLELCMFDKPALNVAYNPPGVDIRPIDYEAYYAYEHYRPVAESGAVTLARSEDELERLLREALAHPERHRAERRALLHRFFAATLDGRSASRVAETLARIAGTDAGGGD